jgi:hypothetical protein
MMKKTKTAIVLILILIAGMAFAQELKFDGYVNSGLGLVITDRVELNDDGTGTQKADPYITAYGVDSGQYGYRFRLNGSYTNADGDAGAKFRFQAQARNQSSVTDTNWDPVGGAGGGGNVTNTVTTIPLSASIPIAFGWVKFFDILTVNAGIIDDGTWESKGAILADDQGEGLGALVKVSPIKGLDLGVGAYANNARGGGDNNVLYRNINGNDSGIDWNEAKYTINGSYTMSDLFRVNATYRGENRAGGGTDPKSNGNSSRAIGEFQLLAVENLTAIVEVELDNLQKFDSIGQGKANIFETVGYKLNDLQFGLNAAQYFSKVDDSDLGLRFNPWVSYTIGKLVPRLDVVYFIAGQVDGSNATGEGKIDRKGYAVSTGSNPGGKYDKDASVIGVRPSLKINLDSKTTFEIGDLVNFEKRDYKFYGVPGDLKDSKFTNTFYVDLTVKF